MRRILPLIPDVGQTFLSFAQRYIKAKGNLHLPASDENRLFGDLRGERQRLLEEVTTDMNLDSAFWINASRPCPSDFHFKVACLGWSPEADKLECWVEGQEMERNLSPFL